MRNKLKPNRKKMKNKELITKRDLIYWLIYCISVSIILATNQLHQNLNIVNYIGFAGTLISIILAVLAIIYSFFQNFTYSNVNNQLIETSEKIEDLINSLKDTSENYSKKNEELIINYDHYTKSLHQMIESKFDITKNEISAISDKLENIKTSSTTEKEKDNTQNLNLKKQDIETFIKKTSVYGRYLIYAVKQLEISKIEFNRKEFFREIFDSSADYAFGFYIATKTIGIFKANIIDENLEQITYLNEHAKELIGDFIDKIEAKEDYNQRQKINDFIKNNRTEK